MKVLEKFLESLRKILHQNSVEVLGKFCENF